LNKGDHFVIHFVGAYNMTQWMQFINLRPRVVLIDLQDQVHVIRENETMEVFKSLEKVPEHLKKFDL
jgi:diaminopimelate decarboxylase